MIALIDYYGNYYVVVFELGARHKARENKPLGTSGLPLQIGKAGTAKLTRFR